MLVGAAKFPVFRQIKLPLILAVGPDEEIDRQTAFHTRMSRIHAHSQSPIGCSCIRRAKCVNAIHAGSTDDDPAKWLVTQKMLRHEIAKVKKAKAEHSGEKGRNRRMIGFCER
jgi:hypothetical protein